MLFFLEEIKFKKMETLLNSVCSQNHEGAVFSVITTSDEGKWSINSEKVSDFWVQYCSLVKDGEEMNLCEIIEDKSPVIIEFVLSFKDGENCFDHKFLQYMFRSIQYSIMDTCIIHSNHKELIGCVLVSDPWKTDRSYTSYKFRFQFPYCVLELDFLNITFKRFLINQLNSLRVTDYLLKNPIESRWDRIFLHANMSSPVALYGSDKILERPKLNLKYIWTNDCLSYIDTEPSQNEIVDVGSQHIGIVFDPQSHFHSKLNLIGKDILAPEAPEDEEDIETYIDKEFWFPMFLSVHYSNELCEINPNSMLDPEREPENASSPYASRRIFGLSTPKDEPEISDLELSEKLLTMLDFQRYFDKLFWLDIVKALNNASMAGEDGLSRLIFHTKNALRLTKDLPDFYNEHGSLEETCRVYYFMNSNTPITFKTLGYYAKNDNPNKYSEWHREWCRASMERSLSCLDADVGDAIYRFFWLDYVCTDYRKGIWYEFKFNRWIETSGGVTLINRCNSDFLKLYLKEKIAIDQLDCNTNDQAFSNSLKFVSKKIEKFISSVKMGKRLSAFIKSASAKLHNDKFHALLDKNPFLTGVLNGVMEIDGEDLVFRCGKPEDYISLCASTQYESSYSWSHPLVVKCYDWMSKVFPDRELLHHFFKFASSGLIGLNTGKTFAIWSGKQGNNSKSMVQKLFEAVYGPLCINLPVAILTGRESDAGSASPHLARARATRFAFISETDDDKPMNKAVIKRYTGGDRYFARFLHENGSEQIATFKMVLVCNEISGIPNADAAVRNRTKIFPYLSEWVINPPETIEKQFEELKFEMDSKFETNIPKLAPAFLWMCCEYYKYFAVEGLSPVPEIVQKTTEKYWQEKDHYAHFISECVRIVKGDEAVSAKVKISELYKRFKDWFMDSYPMCISSLPNITAFKTALSFRWGDPQGQFWRGIVLIDENGEEENDDQVSRDENEISETDKSSLIDIQKIGSISKQGAEQFLSDIKMTKSNMRNIVKNGLNAVTERRTRTDVSRNDIEKPSPKKKTPARRSSQRRKAPA